MGIDPSRRHLLSSRALH